MKLSIRVFLFSLLFAISTKGISKEFLGDRERGWYWFEENKFKKSLKNKGANTKPSKLFDANHEMRELQKSIQYALNLAILVPTEANIQNYLNVQIKAFNMSQRFSETAKVLQLKSPELDYQTKAPYNHHALIIKNQEDRKTAESAVRRLANTHGLFFFFDSVCPYCAVMAPIVLGFSTKYGIPVIPVSIDGGSLKEFPNTVADNGIANAYGVSNLPALFAVNPKTKSVLKLANRVTSITELEDVVLRHEMYNQGNYHGN